MPGSSSMTRIRASDAGVDDASGGASSVGLTLPTCANALPVSPFGVHNNTAQSVGRAPDARSGLRIQEPDVVGQQRRLQPGRPARALEAVTVDQVNDAAVQDVVR